MNLAYSRCMTACSLRRCRGLRDLVIHSSPGKALVCVVGAGVLKKYHDEHTNVSMVSVSRLAALLHTGQVVFRNSSCLAKGEGPSALTCSP